MEMQTMPDREPPLPLSLWGVWWNAISLLRPAFPRLRTFMWFATVVAGLSVRVELPGVTSIVRALNLRPRLYTKLLDHFHSSGIKLDRLSASWTQAVLQLFPHPVREAAGWSWSGTASKPPRAARKCRPSSSCISNRSQTPSRNTSWGTPCRPLACSCTPPRASSACRSASAHP